MPEPVPWEEAERRLRETRVFWLATVRPDGRPHTVPVWAVWHEAALWWGMLAASVKGRNLAANPACAMHPDEGDATVVLEGAAEAVAPWREVLDAPAALAYRAKYGVDADESSHERGIVVTQYRLRPSRIEAWRSPAVAATRAVWRLDSDG